MGEDYFGRPVIVARRLCDLADAGQILVSRSAVELIDEPGAHRFEPIGSLALKGLDDPVSASRLRWETATSSPQESLMGARQERPYSDLLPVGAAL